MSLDIFSAGLFQSIIPYATNPQFIIGPQKWTVFGPIGEFHNLVKKSILKKYVNQFIIDSNNIIIYEILLFLSIECIFFKICRYSIIY